MSLVCSPLPILLITVVNCGATLCMRTPGDDFFWLFCGTCLRLHAYDRGIRCITGCYNTIPCIKIRQKMGSERESVDRTSSGEGDTTQHRE